MTSVSGTDTLAWSDEQTRFYLQLRIEEKLKGNARQQIINETRRQSIIDKFYEAYGERHPWKKFGIKHTTCKKQYDHFKRLIHKRTGLGYDSSGFIDMSDDWWNELCKVIIIYYVLSGYDSLYWFGEVEDTVWTGRTKSRWTVR
ncbi:BnaC03g49160D [Brassica napus]|uniref:BnaC03g49160D protein n=1 Tax=Brassica napus TaxID=3708 RepID=A0A078FQF7_BRANA|nr:BnaC03g49160D [Brassica napus]